MDLPMRPLQCLTPKPLISPTGARLVLCDSDAGYPNSSSSGRGKWFDNIASTDTKEFLQANKDQKLEFVWKWPAVVLMPEEYSLHVGGMSVAELRSQLEKYWGRGGIPGAPVKDGYQDMWVPGWAPNGIEDPYDLPSWQNYAWFTDAPQLDPTIFNCWVNKECAQWLDYFIAKNHTFGVVHAWFAAFLGVTRLHLRVMAELSTEVTQVEGLKCGSYMTAISHKFPISLDKCIEGHDEAIDSIPALPFNMEIMTNRHGMQVIVNSIDNIRSRRVWDICANTVIPATWFSKPPNLPIWLNDATPRVTPVSHAWVAGGDQTFIVTEANQQLWPIPLPKGVLLEDIRGEMIYLGVRYAWLDVLCLRQQAQPALAKDLAIPVSREIVERREQCRLQEWKVDVPTIGAIYSRSEPFTIYKEQIVIFMSGLGRPFQAEGWDSDRHWLRRSWTLQETPVLNQCLIAGLPQGTDYIWDGSVNSRDCWPWKCKVNDCQSLHDAMNNAASIQHKSKSYFNEYADLDAIFHTMRGRHSSNPIDKVCAIALPFQKRGYYGNLVVKFPIYDPNTPVSVAWDKLISSITSAKMHFADLENIVYRKDRYNELKEVRETPTIQLLRLFPHPSRHHWFPSWAQVQQYPDVSVRDDHSVLVAGGMDCSLHIRSGRIYRGCSLRPIRPPTPRTKAVYCATMDGKDAQLVATVPGIELHIDPTSKYVLVDISPDRSLLWDHEFIKSRCKKPATGHEHLPMWQESVIIICEEVDALAQPTSDTVQSTESSSTIMRYRLRRVTTLNWDCRIAAELKSPDPGRWLPFEPSLVHMRSIVCSAKGGYGSIGLLWASDERDPDVFCDPAAVAGLLSQDGWNEEWDKRWPTYEVYLV